MQKLLLVDSGANEASTLQHYLTTIGYKIAAIAKTAEQAIENARVCKPDFIVLDFDIRNKQTGYHLYDTIRQLDNQIPIIYVAPPAA